MMRKRDELEKDVLLKKYNRILFGAPGTGKSFFLEQNRKKAFGESEENFERVTFYPRYSYGQFVGMYKPVPSGNGDGVTYKYVPGPLMRVYAKARKIEIIKEWYENNTNSLLEEYKKSCRKNAKENYFLFPTNPETVWNLFEEIKYVGTEESFKATEEMKEGDFAFVYVGNGDFLKNKKGNTEKENNELTGIYAIARIITVSKPNVEEKEVWLRFDKIYNYEDKPLISFKEMGQISPKLETILQNCNQSLDDKEADKPAKEVGEKSKKINVQSANKIEGELKIQIQNRIKNLIDDKGMFIDKEKLNKEKHLLIIEELNRANAASVFGDVFQLLDRDKEGKSSYSVTTSEEVRDYLAREFYHKRFEECDETQKKECSSLCIPPNMYIWATMNSADQGVEVLDTAFKRRWDFEYIGIDESSDDKYFKDYNIPVNQNQTVNWDKLRRKINDVLSDKCYVKEDKLLGPYFLSKPLLSLDFNNYDNKNLFIEVFKSKVLMYLYEDAAAGNLSALFKCKHNRYSTVCEELDDKGVEIFGFKPEEL